ncbi:ATP-binding SpoIIE family protein phosphatase [Kineococcus radiotolerans]|uniref:Stage II sporulation E family protein n=1 Tax=Kineococcus radiotolerans (strain ATCC BAA-149 / DSM 14245 / SRS30216) TaxID=266940 RepID=A6WFJ6_KINRD|nr:ATP-binding SpoIIE family protein phosphatase [Kineococcus radiotolerans]ABS05585.1 Stage II sporulation E family protein [Kineococcus radiotolerans SRS30216 = ATCC BAA-149]
MSRSSPQALALREPAALLLLSTAPATAAGELLALDGTARAAAGLAGGEAPPRDLTAFRRCAGLPDHPVWDRLEGGEAPAGERLPGDLWVSAGRVPGRDQLLVTVVHTQATEPGAPPGDVVAAGPGTALSALHRDDLVVEWVDGGFTRTTGTPAGEVLGRSPHHLVRTRDEAALAELDRSARRDGPATLTLLDHRADGTAFLHQVRTFPLADRTGAPTHVVSWHSDVTRRTAEEHTDARAAERRATARLEVLRRLDGVVAEDDPTHGVQAIVRVLGDHVVAAAMVLLLRDRPSGPGAEVEVAVAHGPHLHGLLGRSLPRTRQDGPDPLLDPAGPDAPDVLDVASLAAGRPAGSPSAWLAGLTAGTGALALPLRGREDVVGVLVVVPHPAGIGPEDRTVLTSAARRAGLLVENARLHAREHALAETLQRSMLPDPTGADGIDGLDVWTFYSSNVEHAQVGGDWYDVLPGSTGAGGQHVAGIVVGDVVGHDVEAAAAMGQIRSVVRSAAHEFDDPASVLMRVDQLTGGMRIARMASLVYATLQRLDDGGWEMAWSSAGHLPPLLRRGGAADGEPRRVEVLSEATGTLVGLGERPRPTRERALAPGDVLVFYTDGLIETRARPMHDGLEVLVDVLGRSRARDAAGIGEELLAGLGDTPEDDTAIVVVRVPEESERDGEPLPTADTPRRRRWQLPSEPSSIGKARHATLRACAVWGLEVGPQAEIVVSELVANAVLHGWGTVGLRLFDLPGALRLEVEDDSPEEPQVVEARPDGGGGHGMRLVASLGRWGTTRTRRGKIVWVEIPTAPED